MAYYTAEINRIAVERGQNLRYADLMGKEMEPGAF